MSTDPVEFKPSLGWKAFVDDHGLIVISQEDALGDLPSSILLNRGEAIKLSATLNQLAQSLPE
jgi:hypothetical protein